MAKSIFERIFGSDNNNSNNHNNENSNNQESQPERYRYDALTNPERVVDFYYSAMDAEQNGSITLILKNGESFEYTCMHNHDRKHSIDKIYDFEDRVEVATHKYGDIANFDISRRKKSDSDYDSNYGYSDYHSHNGYGPFNGYSGYPDDPYGPAPYASEFDHERISRIRNQYHDEDEQRRALDNEAEQRRIDDLNRPFR